ncbi:MAG TPA: hypothetical protein VFL76_10965 [Edaphocola sp.]|nr:hypothetical protein [Edaphocola sp.]
MKNIPSDANCSRSGGSQELSCRLTSPGLRKRKETVLEKLKEQTLEKKALPNGFAFRFPGNDIILDELAAFIKTERECCSFFTFELAVRGDKSEIWLTLTGPEGVKDFIVAELGF